MAHPNDQAISQTQFLKYAQDLAEVYGLEKKRRRQLQEAYEGLLALVDSMHDGALIFDSQLEIQAANAMAGDILTATQSPIVGRNISDLLPEEPVVERLKAASSPEATPLPPDGIEFSTESGKVFRITLTRMQNGWCFILLHNITAHIRTEKLKSDFLSMISHELRTPLTGILGFTELLKDDPSLNSPQTQDSLALIRESGIRMLNTVEALLHFATLQGERIEMRNEPLQLSLVASNAMESLQHLAETHGIALHLVHDPRRPVIIQGNAAMLKDLFRQIIQNGILFGKEGGSVCIKLNKGPSEAVIEIEDNGIGIPAESLTKVFDSFYQEEECLNRNRDGLGLGLSLARLIVESHGGNIFLSSLLGKGTTCHITLPELCSDKPAELAPTLSHC